MTQLYNMKPIITVCPGAPTRLTVNIAAVAAANKVHWTVPQNLLRKPETHANLEKHKIRHLISVLNIFYYKRYHARTEQHNQPHTWGENHT